MARCMGCMEELPEDSTVCGYCGYRKGTDVKEAYYLLPGTVVGEKYIIGRVLGYGGFGVTYIGWDSVLRRKVAVKEYLPSDFATRSYGTKRLTVFSGEAAKQFEAGLKSFIFEARRLAKFNMVSEIVDIYDCFEENGSGYIVMEYLKGATIKEILKKKKRISVEQARFIVLSVLRGLRAVHKEGIIHRDIAPDNIFLTEKGEVKILDFGAARYATAVQSRSLSVILKPGYAPEEQYRSHGEQGPWTDVYALGATFYRMITGIRPEESIQRLAEDHLKNPSAYGIAIDRNIENALMNSMNVHQEYRIPDAESFYKALRGKEEVVRIVEKTKTKIEFKMPVWLKCGLAAACILVCVCIGLFATGNMSFTIKKIAGAAGMSALGASQCYVPNVSGMSYSEAEKLLKQKQLHIMINGMNYSGSIEKNKILSQTPKDGAIADEEDTIYVIMSGGREEVMMPDLSGMTREEAEQLIQAQNLIIDNTRIREIYSDVVEKGRVISQSIEAEERIAVQTEVFFSVSLGSLSEETAVLTVPDLEGLTKEQAVDKLEQMKKEFGFTYSLGAIESRYSSRVEKGRIISQGLEAGSQVRTNEVIDLVISKGPQMVQVPNVIYISSQEAIKKLEQAGLHVDVNQEYSSQTAKGLVIRQSIPADSKAAKGSSITITVSLGKAPVQPADNYGDTGMSGSQEQPGADSSGEEEQPKADSSGEEEQPKEGSSGEEETPEAGSTGEGEPPEHISESGSDNGSEHDAAGGKTELMPDGGSFVVE